MELIQKDCSSEKIKKELDNLIYNSSYKDKMLNSFKELKAMLGDGTTSKKIAQSLIEDIKLINYYCEEH